MEGLSIIIPVYNRIEMTLRCIEQIRRQNRNSTYELIVFDNGSTDSTPDLLSSERGLHYIRDEKNLGISGACNRASEKASYPFLCFMHNDLFIFRQDWVRDIVGFFEERPQAGVVGLYGAKTIRRDGSYRGKSIVHAKKDSPLIDGPFEDVVGVDGLLMAIPKGLFEEIGRYDENFTIHFYDKDLSMKAYTGGRKNYVLNIPFVHECGRTRKGISSEDTLREEQRRLFLDKWGERLPCSVFTMADWFRHVLWRRRK